VNNVKSESVEKEAEAPIALLDCGQASKVTHGVPYLPLFEMGWPPFDRLLY
jgi:hypothetical protein